MSGITVKVGIADPYPTNLVLAVQIGGAPGTSGNSHLAIIDEKDPVNPKRLAVWPKTDILGSGVPFEILRKQPAVDPRTKLVAVAVRKISGTPGSDATWFVLDLSTPETPTVIAVVPGMGWAGSMYGGYLTVLSQGQLQMVSLPIAQAPQSVKRGSVATATVQSPIAWKPPIFLTSLCLSGPPMPPGIVHLDFVAYNQGVEQYLTGEMQSSSVPGLPAIPGFALENKVPVIAQRPMRLRAYFSASATDTVNLVDKKVTVRLQIVPKGVSGLYPDNVSPKGRYAIADMPITTIKLADQSSANRLRFGVKGSAATFIIENPGLIQVDDSIQFIVESGPTKHTIAGAFNVPIPLNVSPSAQLQLHVVPVQYVMAGIPNPVIPAPRPPDRQVVLDAIRRFFPASFDTTLVNVIIEPQITYTEDDPVVNRYGVVRSEEPTQVSILNDSGTRHLAARMGLSLGANFPEAVDTPYGQFACALVNVTEVKRRRNRPPTGTTGATATVADSIRTHLFWVDGGRPAAVVVQDMSHELGHAHGLAHIGEPACRQDRINMDWPGWLWPAGTTNPYLAGAIGVPGWDVVSSIEKAATYKDLMAYDATNIWVSDYHFSRMFRHMPHSGDPALNILDERLYPGVIVEQFKSGSWQSLGNASATCIAGGTARIKVRYVGPQGPGIGVAQLAPHLTVSTLGIGEYLYRAPPTPPPPGVYQTESFNFTFPTFAGAACASQTKVVTINVYAPEIDYFPRPPHEIILRSGEDGRTVCISGQGPTTSYPSMRVRARDPIDADPNSGEFLAWTWHLSTDTLGSLVTDPLTLETNLQAASADRVLGEMWAEDPTGPYPALPRIPIEVRSPIIDFKVLDGTTEVPPGDPLRVGKTYTVKAVAKGYTEAELISDSSKIHISVTGCVQSGGLTEGLTRNIVVTACSPGSNQVVIQVDLMGISRCGSGDPTISRPFLVVP
ncbi:MAG: hypothetical protein IPP78_09965 [Holophagaceae bacterium]|nr:hypothetical protein [Holophagaceae bacterium]